ncbi:MAG: ABC transporter ATP-binding protein [Gemmatimonadaceae bacterium]
MNGADALGVHCDAVGCVYASRRGDVRALERVSFDVRGHGFVSVVGPSGCGKSTLLRVLAGLQPPTTGSVSLTPTLPNGSSRPRAGLVFQEYGTFPWMTVLENLAFGLEMAGVATAERLQRAQEFAERLGLAAFGRYYPRELSVGMRQRVDIGRAFVSDAPILLMDEPFGALDAQTRWVLQIELLRIWQESRKLVVFVTHDIEEAVRLSDRVIVLSGRPGTVRAEITIPLTRPRDLKRDDTAVRDITWQIWQLLEHEVRDGLAIRQ